MTGGQPVSMASGTGACHDPAMTKPDAEGVHPPPDPADVVIARFEAEPSLSTHAALRRTGRAEVDVDALHQRADRGRGHASGLLRTLLGFVDDEAVTLTLTAMPLHVDPLDGGSSVEPGLDADALVAWYRRHGFKVDGEEWGCPTMRRRPVPPRGQDPDPLGPREPS